MYIIVTIPSGFGRGELKLSKAPELEWDANNKKMIVKSHPVVSNYDDTLDFKLTEVSFIYRTENSYNNDYVSYSFSEQDIYDNFSSWDKGNYSLATSGDKGYCLTLTEQQTYSRYKAYVLDTSILINSIPRNFTIQ